MSDFIQPELVTEDAPHGHVLISAVSEHALREAVADHVAWMTSDARKMMLRREIDEAIGHPGAWRDLPFKDVKAGVKA